MTTRIQRGQMPERQSGHAPFALAIAVALCFVPAGCGTVAQTPGAGFTARFTAEEATATGGLEPARGLEPTSPVRTLSADPVLMAGVDTEPELGTDFDVDLALRHVRALSDMGVREAGSETERRAAEYVAAELRKLGYVPRIESIGLPNGRITRNVIAVKQGTGDARVIIGGHMDSKSPSPGANDNATGVGAMLAMADRLSREETYATIEFVAFGAEELIDADSNHHHFGSRYRVQAMTTAERSATVAMFSVDMIGYGPEFHARTMRKGPQSLSDDLLEFARERGVGMTYRRDEGSSGWSDHEAFELAGIPAVWIEWRDDPVYHTAKDTPGHLSKEKVRVAGQLVLDYVRAIDAERADKLR